MSKVSLFLKSLFCILFLCSINAKANLMSDCNATTSDINKSTPQTLDKVTTLLNAICTNDGGPVTLVYRNRLNVPAGSVTQNEINTLKPGMLNTLCTDPTLRQLINTVNVRYTYADASGRFLGQVDLNKRESR